jgi:predicted DNA-binding antitoxin AbrB/MazE fold protein
MMEQSIEAIYEGGVLRPLEQLSLHEHQRVEVIVRALPQRAIVEPWEDSDFLEECQRSADAAVSLTTVREALARIPGSIADDVVAERDDR